MDAGKPGFTAPVGGEGGSRGVRFLRWRNLAPSWRLGVSLLVVALLWACLIVAATLPALLGVDGGSYGPGIVSLWFVVVLASWAVLIFRRRLG